ncbi:MAG: metal-sensing transcriptional repressor [Dehalococcoidia bacterium]|nr:metal-sensing transcriptional repressor [Dehalococcoidia bacterium]
MVQRRRPYTRDIESLRRRMKRIEGQARGILKMIDDDRYCIDIVQQLASLAAAANEVSMIILRDHIEGCVSQAIRDRQDADKYVDELMDTIRKVMKR